MAQVVAKKADEHSIVPRPDVCNDAAHFAQLTWPIGLAMFFGLCGGLMFGCVVYAPSHEGSPDASRHCCIPQSTPMTNVPDQLMTGTLGMEVGRILVGAGVVIGTMST